MARRPPWVFKELSEPWELDAVRRLNYRTFVEEIPQHSPNAERSLADRLLDRSTCFVCVEETERLRGMIAVCGERPFSLDAKVPDLDRHLPLHRTPCEVRLFAVEREHRGGPVFAGLLSCVLRHSRRRGWDLGLISATERQERLYRHLGFTAFGPPLGTPEARYQGMYVTWDLLAGSAVRMAEGSGIEEGERG